MSPDRKSTSADLEAALEKTVPSAEFDAAGTRRELSATQQEFAAPSDEGHFLERTAEDHTPPGTSDTSGLEGFGDSTEVPPQLRPQAHGRQQRFEVKRELGRGGNAMVFEVHDHSLGRTIALKLLHEAAAVREGRRQRFIHEARVTAMLEHPNIVPVYDIGVTPRNRVYFLMKNVGGVSLGDAIRSIRKGGMGHESLRTIDGKLRVFLKVCDAMEFAHARGFIHQDIKPDNLMLGGYGEVLVMDWGCALSSDEAEETGHRPVFGTPAYMSPEQARRERSDERSDIYCMGATLYHLLTLRHPTWTDDPERFWEMKRQGELSPLPPEVEGSIPALLLEIARKAMTPDGAARYQTVTELRQAIEQYQNNAASVALVEEGRQLLAAAREHRSYEEFRRCLYNVEQALRLWPENRVGRDVLSEARRAFAWCALDRGDIELAAETIEPERDDGGVRTAIEAAREAIRRRQRTLRLMKVSVALLSLMVIAATAYAAYEYFLQFGRWHPVYQMDFTKPGADLSGLSFCDFDVTKDSTRDSCGPSGLTLAFTHGDQAVTSGAEMFWLRNVRAPGDIQVRLEVMWPDSVDGLEVHINARREPLQSGGRHPAGFSCQFGGYGDRINFVSRNDVPQSADNNGNVQATFEPGRTYELCFQRIGEELSLWVDGQRILTQIEVLPLAGKGLDKVAVRSWSTVLIRKLTVSRLTLPQRASPLLAGDALVREGSFVGGVERYLEVARDYPGKRLEEEALARAYFAAAQAGLPADSLTALRMQFDQRFPTSRLAPVVHEAEAVSLWRRGRRLDALALADGVLRADPENRVALRLLAVEHQPLAPEVARKLLELLARTTRVGWLTLTDYDLTDIAPLAGMQLTTLNISDNRIESLTPLAGMPLRSLTCSNNAIAGLAPLAGMPLTTLTAYSNEIRDLGPLVGMPLHALDVSDNQIGDLEPLRGTRLRKLDIASNPISSLEPLRGLQLEELDMARTQVHDLSPLRGMPLQTLSAGLTPVCDLSPLAGIPLQSLDITLTSIHDLSPLRGMPLSRLTIVFCPVSDLGPLAGMPLRSLSCSGTRVRDLSPLTDLPLVSLMACALPITDVQPLTGMRTLKTLWIDSTLVTDLRPLAGASLHTLSAIGTPLRSLAPFESNPPPRFTFESAKLSDGYLEPILARWSRDSSNADVVRGARVLRAVRTGRHLVVRSLATPFGGRRYLFLPVTLTFGEARALAGRLGGHLVTITSGDEQAFVGSTVLPKQCTAWLGIDSIDGRIGWVTHEARVFTAYASHFALRQPPPHFMLCLFGNCSWATLRSQFGYHRTRCSLVVEWEEDGD